jgi:hypothetical protein
MYPMLYTVVTIQRKAAIVANRRPRASAVNRRESPGRTVRAAVETG